jgi:hypothetical protein
MRERKAIPPSSSMPLIDEDEEGAKCQTKKKVRQEA